MNRRQFMHVTGAALSVGAAEIKAGPSLRTSGRRPVVIGSENGLKAAEEALRLLNEGADTLDAVEAAANRIEEDPEEMTVGLGGRPNEEGVVQLDASVMHGPTRGAGAVAALEGIVHVSSVARKVMEYTNHVLLIGEGALRFALAMGFRQQELLTPKAREEWLEWRRNLSPDDNWIDPADRIPATPGARGRVRHGSDRLSQGTVHFSAVNARGEISGVTSTSGLAYKIPGRVGDSPIIGAGLYVDNDVGACGSTGRGESNIKTCASFMVVEFMRQGLEPNEAALRIVRRVVEHTVEPYLLDEEGRPVFDLKFYAVNKEGVAGGASIWSGARIAVCDDREARLQDLPFVFEREEDEEGNGTEIS